MSKKFIIIFLLAMLAGAVGHKEARAQIFILSEEEFNNRASSSAGNLVPLQGGENDLWGNNYTPLGSGWLLLSGLGGAYLLSKRQKHKED